MESTVFKKVTHYIYDTKEEFEKHFMVEDGVVPEIKKWKEGQIGDWVLSDDNRIIQILGRKEYFSRESNTPAVFIRTVVGTFVVRTDKMDTDLTLRDYPRGRYQIGKRHGHWKAKQKYRDKLTYNESQLIKRLFEGDDPVQSYFEIYKCMYLKVAKIKLTNLLKQPRIIGAIMGKTPAELAEELGIGVKDQLQKYKDLLEKEDDTDKVLKILDKLGEVVDIEQKKASGGWGIGFIPGQLSGGNKPALGSGQVFPKEDDE